MSDQDSIIQRKFLPVSLLLIGFPPRAQQFASRKPTCAGPTQIYYFTILLTLREIGSLHLENPTLHVGPGFYYPEKIPPCLFTVNRISSTGSAVCISKTHLCRSDPDFTILLFYYFTNFTGNREFPPCLFTFNRISSTGSAVCISKTHLCRSDPDFTILLLYYFTILLVYYFTNFTGNREFASRKPNLACRTRILLSRENSSLSLYF